MLARTLCLKKYFSLRREETNAFNKCIQAVGAAVFVDVPFGNMEIQQFNCRGKACKESGKTIPDKTISSFWNKCR